MYIYICPFDPFKGVNFSQNLWMQVKPNHTMNGECGQAFKTLEDLIMYNREAHVDGTTAATIGQVM